MKYKQIHFHLDYVEKYNGIAAGIVENTQNLTPGSIEKRKNSHELKAATLLRDGIARGSGGKNGNQNWGSHERKPGEGMERYEKMTEAKNAKRIAAGLEPYRPIGKAKKPRK